MMEVEMISCADDVIFIIGRIIVGIILSFFGYILISKRKILADVFETSENGLWKKPGSYPFKIEKFVKIRIFFLAGIIFLVCGMLILCTELYSVIICLFA